jgi:hypothetical protein
MPSKERCDGIRRRRRNRHNVDDRLAPYGEGLNRRLKSHSRRCSSAGLADWQAVVVMVPSSQPSSRTSAGIDAPVAMRVVTWMCAAGLVAAQLATVLASSRTTWFGGLCVSIVLFGCLAVSRSLLIRQDHEANPEEEHRPGITNPSTFRSWNWFTLSAMTLLLFVGLLKAPHRSDDVYAYGAYGRIVSEHSASPYATRPAAFPGDPVINRMAKGWRNTRSVYGPAFTAWSAVGMRVAGTSEWIERLWFQALAALATGCSALLLKRMSPAHWWLFALNPVTLIAVAHEGHNDALVGLGILSALWFLTRASAAASARSRWIHGAIGSMVFAASIKITAILAVPALAVWILRHVGWKRAAQISAPWVFVSGGLFAATGGPVAFDAFRGLRTFRSTTSIWHLHWIRELTDRADGKPGVLALTFPAAALAMAGLFMLAGPNSAPLRVPPVSPLPTGKPDRGLLVLRRSWQSWQSGRVSDSSQAFDSNDHLDHIDTHTYGFSHLVARALLPLIVFISLGLYILPWYWGWLLAPAILLPSKLRNVVLFSAAAHTVAYGAGTQLYDNFATVLSIARFVTPLALVVVLAIAVFVVWQSQVQKSSSSPVAQ